MRFPSGFIVIKAFTSDGMPWRLHMEHDLNIDYAKKKPARANAQVSSAGTMLDNQIQTDDDICEA